jgi:hypothetical protein
MKNKKHNTTLFIFFLLLGLFSCSPKEEIEPPASHQIIGVWKMHQAIWRGLEIDRDYSKYRLSFEQKSNYLLVNEFGKESFGKYIMIKNGEELIFNPGTNIADTIFVQKVSKDSLWFRYKDFASFRLYRNK